ncbi:uncharacterized protein PpBr36_10639 [Pyricularia pennisetigena]|uniref:uncharacterized protein n=1 Tax=Pyricularia pennisetigena TaxID=1578925 RepID=UPI00115075AA|nr:uncharacterized protein PpBr36_10639 [Pyricularia pennisetigena]TLS21195.1 hypothetical protein PpBr36_10639 [Pyricularia pennisetigena]
MNGTWLLNKQLSDDLDPTFAAQGVPFILRKMLKFAGVRIDMTEDLEASPAPTIHFKQIVSPGGFHTEEDYVLDAQYREGTVPIFGTISVQARFLPMSKLDDEGLRTQLEEGGTGDVVIEEKTTSKLGWECRGIWGFEKIDGERRFVRTNFTKKGGEQVTAKLVYDFRP